MAINEDCVNYLKDQLSPLGAIEIKKMFGGLGFFKDGSMFGMLAGSSFKLKVDASNEADYMAKGMKPYQSDTKKKGMPYWEVPADVLEDPATLSQWALKSIAIAHAKKNN